jgi:trk system potassium uptake protein TrkA
VAPVEAPEVGLAEAVPVDVPGVDVVELVLGAGPVAGRRLADVPLPAGVRLAVIDRGGEALVPTGATVLEEGDRLVAMAVGRLDLAEAVEGWATQA